MLSKKLLRISIIVISIILMVAFIYFGDLCRDVMCIQEVGHTSSLSHMLFHSTRYKAFFYLLAGAFGMIALVSGLSFVKIKNKKLFEV